MRVSRAPPLRAAGGGPEGGHRGAEAVKAILATGLVSAQGDPNNVNDTPFSHVIKADQPDLIWILLHAGAELDHPDFPSPLESVLRLGGSPTCFEGFCIQGAELEKLEDDLDVDMFTALLALPAQPDLAPGSAAVAFDCWTLGELANADPALAVVTVFKGNTRARVRLLKMLAIAGYNVDEEERLQFYALREQDCDALRDWDVVRPKFGGVAGWIEIGLFQLEPYFRRGPPSLGTIATAYIRNQYNTCCDKSVLGDTSVLPRFLIDEINFQL